MIPGWVKGVAVCAVLLVLIMIGAAGCTRIGPGHVGIEVNLAGSQRGVQDFTIKTGWVVYNPLSSSIVEYPTYIQTAKWTQNPNEGDNPESGKGANEELSFQSSEGMTVHVDVSLSYHLTENKIPAFYVKFRNDNIVQFTHGFLRNEARNAFNDAGGDYRVEDIIGQKKEMFMAEVFKKLQARVSDIGVVIDQLGFIDAPRPPEQVMQAINMKVQATQLALQKQNELVQAQAEAAKTVAYAEGDAKAAIARATGQAQANRLINESLSDKVLERTRLDLQWHYIDKWDGHRASVESGTGSGMLFQIQK